MKEAGYEQQRETLVRAHARLRKFEESGTPLAPDYCTDLIKQYWCWMALHAVAVTLEATPKELEAIQNGEGFTAAAARRQRWRSKRAMACDGVCVCWCGGLQWWTAAANASSPCRSGKNW